MLNKMHTADFISIRQIARNVNNDNLNEEILAFDTGFSIENEEAFPLRINALVIALCLSGTGKSASTSGIQIEEKQSDCYSTQKLHLLSQYSPDFRCAVVACSKRVVDDVFPRLTDILPILIHHRTEPVTQLSDSEADDIFSFYSFLRSKLKGPRTTFLKQKVLCMLQAALYEMMDIHQKNSERIDNQRSRKEEIMAKFILAVSEEFRTQRQVAYYARKFYITPKHLSAVVKEISGRTAGDWIENYVVMEAKVLLKTTDKTIQEITLMLNFANQSFFGKYFKHHTGLSPTAYRKKFS